MTCIVVSFPFPSLHTTLQSTSTSQLVLLLATRNLPKLLLRHALEKPRQPAKHLLHALPIQRIHIGLPDQRLDLDQTLAIQMIPQPLIDLLEHRLEELGTILAPDVEDAVHEPRRHQVLDRNPLRHDQRLVGLADAEALDKRKRGVALGHEAQRAERREDEGVRRGVDEVGEGDEGRAEADRRAVERRHQDLRVRVEGVRDVQVVGHEVLQPHLPLVDVVGRRHRRAEGYVCAAGCWLVCNVMQYIYTSTVLICEVVRPGTRTRRNTAPCPSER